MAIFDPVEQRMCVRIVYDGAGGAGKTTNLGALCHLFATQHTTELYSPGELDGRTLYFDWVQIMAGLVCGYPLMCQVISVPGQTVLTPRRRHLLSSADVVVLVCDSSPSGVERAREGLRMIDEMSIDRPLSLVVQANKQDQVHALSGNDVLRALGREGTSVVEAIATGGIGVIDTFVTAVRTISKDLQALSETVGLEIAVGRAPRATQLLLHLESLELDPEWAAEMFLEEAQASLLIEGGFDTPISVLESRRGAPPILPRADVETGFVWPAHTGRLVLGTLSAVGDQTSIALDASGRAEVDVSGYRLRTTRDQRFEDREEARQALVRAARERTQLEHLLPPSTVLALQPARDGAWWLWTVRSAIPMLSETHDASDGGRGDLLRAYGVALVDLLRVCLRNGLTMNFDAVSFGIVDGQLRYVGEISGMNDGATIADAVVGAVDDVGRRGWDVQLFMESFEQALQNRLTREEVEDARIAMVRTLSGHRSGHEWTGAPLSLSSR